MKKTAVWGCGGKLQELVDFFPELIDRIDILIDRNVKLFCDKEVSNPDILSTVKDFLLIICVRSFEDRADISREAKERYGIKKEQIISVNQWLIGMLRSGEGLLLRPTSIMLDASTLCQLNCTKCSMRIRNYGGLGAGYQKFSNFKKLVDDNPFI